VAILWAGKPKNANAANLAITFISLLREALHEARSDYANVEKKMLYLWDFHL
jgi:hypothetical protein